MRQHGDHPQLGLGAQGVGERLGDLGRPQVLVLDVDESFGPLEGLGVAPRHTSLATAGEGVVAAVSKVRIGTQQLDHVRTAGHRSRRRRLRRQRVGPKVIAGQPVAQPTDRAPAQRRRIRPALAEHRLDVVDSRSGDGGLDVVPRRMFAVGCRHRLGLRVAEVPRVVPPRVAQVDAADEGDVALRVAGVPDDDELLVMRTAGADPHVEQRLRALGLQLLAGLPVLGAGEGQLVPVRAPDQSADVDSAPVGVAEQPDHGRLRIVGELLVRVAAPVGEQDQIARPRLFDALLELGEVGRTVDERPYVVADRPRLLTRMGVVEHRLRVGPLGLGQQPLGQRRRRLRPRPWLIGLAWAAFGHRPNVFRRLRSCFWTGAAVGQPRTVPRTRG